MQQVWTPVGDGYLGGMIAPTVLERSDGVTIVRLLGEHDVFTAPGLREQVIGAVEAGEPVVVDIQEATFIDSSILAVLLGGLRRAREGGSGFAIVLETGTDSAVSRIFEVTGLVPVFPIYPDREAAIAAAASGLNA
jgi:anti-sigma B factor antagonist